MIGSFIGDILGKIVKLAINYTYIWKKGYPTHGQPFGPKTCMRKNKGGMTTMGEVSS
jgi:hypothetical protein